MDVEVIDLLNNIKDDLNEMDVDVEDKEPVVKINNKRKFDKTEIDKITDNIMKVINDDNHKKEVVPEIIKNILEEEVTQMDLEENLEENLDQSQLEQQNAELRNENAQLRNENAQLQDNNKNLERHANRLAVKKNELQVLAEQNAAQLEQQNEQLRKLAEQNEQLRKVNIELRVRNDKVLVPEKNPHNKRMQTRYYYTPHHKERKTYNEVSDDDEDSNIEVVVGGKYDSLIGYQAQTAENMYNNKETSYTNLLKNQFDKAEGPTIFINQKNKNQIDKAEGPTDNKNLLDESRRSEAISIPTTTTETILSSNYSFPSEYTSLFGKYGFYMSIDSNGQYELNVMDYEFQYKDYLKKYNPYEYWKTYGFENTINYDSDATPNVSEDNLEVESNPNAATNVEGGKRKTIRQKYYKRKTQKGHKKTNKKYTLKTSNIKKSNIKMSNKRNTKRVKLHS